MLYLYTPYIAGESVGLDKVGFSEIWSILPFSLLSFSICFKALKAFIKYQSKAYF